MCNPPVLYRVFSHSLAFALSSTLNPRLKVLLSLSVSLSPRKKTHPRVAVDVWSLFKLLHMCLGIDTVQSSPLGLSVGQMAGVPGLEADCVWVGGGELTWPKACHDAPRVRGAKRG